MYIQQTCRNLYTTILQQVYNKTDRGACLLLVNLRSCKIRMYIYICRQIFTQQFYNRTDRAACTNKIWLILGKPTPVQMKTMIQVSLHTYTIWLGPLLTQSWILRISGLINKSCRRTASSPAGYILYCDIFIIKPYNIGHTDLDVSACKSFCHTDIIIQVWQFSME